MKVLKDGFPTHDDAQKWASNHGLTGYIINGPNIETGEFCVKVMTMPATEMGLEQPPPPPPPGLTALADDDDQADLAYILNWYLKTTARYVTDDVNPALLSEQGVILRRRRAMALRLIGEPAEPARPYHDWRTDDLITRLSEPFMPPGEREAVADELRRRAEAPTSGA